MAGLFKKIAKGFLLGTGSILSLINPAIGAPLIVAGSAINTTTAGSVDPTAVYGQNLQTSLQNAAAMQSAQSKTGAILAFDSIIYWIKNNMMLIIAGVLAWMFLPKLFNKRKRR